MTLPPEEITQLMRFIAKKTKHVKSPMNIKGLASQFKKETESLLSVNSLKKRIEKSRLKIHKINEFDKKTKVKMMFAVSAPIDKGFLNELKKQANVGVDGKGRITNFKENDGSLELEGSHGKRYIQKALHSDRWQKACQKANDAESEEEGDEDANGQKHREDKRVDLVRFLIERTKNATTPLSITKLAADYKSEFKSSGSQLCIHHRITRFRPRIFNMNQFDMPTKVKMLFALSAPIDDNLLKELQKDAIVELDENQKITKYKANDGSLDLEGDHSRSAKVKAGLAKKKKKKVRVVNDWSDSEGDEEEKGSSETNGSDDKGNVGGSLKLNQASTSSPKTRSTRYRKSTISTKNNNRKRTTIAKTQSGMSRGEKRTRIAYTSSESSEDDEESVTLENDPSMASNADNGGEDFVYDPPANNHYDEDLEHNVTDPNSGRNIETPEVRDEVDEEGKREEESSACSSAKIESMTLLELLNHLRSPIAQYTPALVPTIDENIKKLESEDQQISFQLIIESLESCIQILNTPDEMDPEEDTTSLPNFFYRLGMAICNITHPSMDDFYMKIKKLACTGDKKVSMEHIRYAMGKTVDKILH